MAPSWERIALVVIILVTNNSHSSFVKALPTKPSNSNSAKCNLDLTNDIVNLEYDRKTKSFSLQQTPLNKVADIDDNDSNRTLIEREESSSFLSSTQQRKYSSPSFLRVRGLNNDATEEETYGTEVDGDDEAKRIHKRIYKAKLCPCGDGNINYCLLNNGEGADETTMNPNVCATDHNHESGFSCYQIDSSDQVIRNAFPVILLWYGAVLLYMVSSETGRHTIKYVFFKVCRREDEYLRDLATSVMEYERLMTVRLEEYERQARLREGNSNVTYLLKTKEYKKVPSSPSSPSSSSSPEIELSTTSSPMSKSSGKTLPLTPGSAATSNDDNDDSIGVGGGAHETAFEDSPPHDLNDIAFINQHADSFEDNSISPLCTPCKPTQGEATDIQHYNDCDDNDDEEEVTCSICLTAIEDGDRIGALECDHKFHVDCLKEWIRRRNVCPLCQTPDIADVKRSANDNDDDGGSGAEASNSPTNTNNRASTNNARVQRLRALQRDVVRTRLFPANVNSGGGGPRRPLNDIMSRPSTNATNNNHGGDGGDRLPISSRRTQVLMGDGNGNRTVVRVSTRHATRRSNSSNVRTRSRRTQGLLPR